MNTRVLEVSAFTKNGAGGNPAGVVLDSLALPSVDRQRIAQEAAFSETAFVSNDGGRLEFEFFTPTKPIDICGHATVGALSLMRDMALIGEGDHTFHTVLGQHRAEVRKDRVGLWQERAIYEPLDSSLLLEPVSQALGLASNLLQPNLTLVSNGTAFLLVELTSASVLQSIRPDLPGIEGLSTELNTIGFYVYALKKAGHVEARMFAPRYGINEESATGMAAGALALHLQQKGLGPTFSIEQGHLMPKPSPSLLLAEAKASDRVLVSGEASNFIKL